MSQIRKRSLKAATWIYLGFFIGAINTYLYTHKGWFEPAEYGLTRSLLDIGILVCAFSTMGVTSFIVKFFPYYSDNLEERKNDLLAVAVYVAAIGFLITSLSLFALEPIIIRKFGTTSPLLVEYFYYVIPIAFFVLLYNILEAYSYGFDKGILTSLLKETVLRFFTTLVIILKIFKLINFETFIVLFALQYAVIVLILILHLKKENKLWINLRISKVTLKFRKKIFAILAFTFIVIVVSVLRQSIDGLVLAAKQDLGKVAIFGLSSYLVSAMQAPFRSLVAITLPILSRSWKNKDVREISRIYSRSSINLLTFSLFLFFCVWLNFDNAIISFELNPAYAEGKWVFFILGMVTIIEMGTGVNEQIIGTSIFWRFELWTSMLLTVMIIPLSYTLTVKYGIFGPALANLISFTVYNFVRFWFLWKKFRMQPFSRKTLEVIFISVLCYAIVYYLSKNYTGLIVIFLASLTYALLFSTCVYYRNISPDVKPVIASITKRFKRK